MKWRPGFPAVGDRVRMTKHHPNAGLVGEVVRYSVYPGFLRFGPLPIVQGYWGSEWYITEAKQWEPVAEQTGAERVAEVTMEELP